jgi:hypothetical protein
MNVIAVMTLRILLAFTHIFVPDGILWTVLLIMILDKLDEHIDVTNKGIEFSVAPYPKAIKDPKKKEEYEYYENITDISHYAIALYFIREEIKGPWEFLIYGVFIYRVVGVGLFTIFNQKWILDVFGDVFQEMLLSASFLSKAWANIWFVVGMIVLHSFVPFREVYDTILGFFGI